MIGLVLLGWLAAALVAVVPVLAGRWARRAGASWMSLPLAVLLLLAAGFALLVALEAVESDSGSRHPGVGEGVVTFVVCALPVVAFYSLGYRVRRDRVLGSLWLAGSIPFTGYAALAGISLINDVICSPSCGLS
jgi:FtsH-binding integral membrane protein